MQPVEPGLGDPEALSEHQARCREWDPIRAVHQGQRSSVPHKQAAHMTAPDRLAEPLNKTLAQRGRPHMTTPLGTLECLPHVRWETAMPSRWVTLLALSIASLVGGLAPTTSQAQKLEAAYVILGAQAPVARVVITGATECPTITIDNTPQPMSIRAEADADFPVLVCEVRVPNRAASAS